MITSTAAAVCDVGRGSDHRCGHRVINCECVELSLKEDAVAASPSVVDDRLARWPNGFDDLFALVAGRFAQADSRGRVRA